MRSLSPSRVSPNPAQLTEITDRYPNVTVIWSARVGASAARNAGACSSDAELLLFLDDDCEGDADWVATYAERFRDDPSLDIAGGRVLLDKNDASADTSSGFKTIRRPDASPVAETQLARSTGAEIWPSDGQHS